MIPLRVAWPVFGQRKHGPRLIMLWPSDKGWIWLPWGVLK